MPDTSKRYVIVYRVWWGGPLRIAGPFLTTSDADGDRARRGAEGKRWRVVFLEPPIEKPGRSNVVG